MRAPACLSTDERTCSERWGLHEPCPRKGPCGVSRWGRSGTRVGALHPLALRARTATMTDMYSKIHTARFGKVQEEIAPLEFVRPLSELCLRSAAMHFRHRPTFAGVPEKYKVPRRAAGRASAVRCRVRPGRARARSPSPPGLLRCSRRPGPLALTLSIARTRPGPAGRADSDRPAAQRVGAADRQRGVLEAVRGRPVPGRAHTHMHACMHTCRTCCLLVVWSQYNFIYSRALGSSHARARGCVRQTCVPSDHGHSWKQLFFEKTVEEALENFDGSEQVQ